MLSLNPLYLLEISPNSPKYLSEIDKIFNNLKNSNYSRNNLLKAQTNLSNTLTKVLGVEVEFKNELCHNAMVLPIYRFITIPLSQYKGLLNDKLLHIEKIYMYLDLPFFLNKFDLSPQELTAILLHEIGHTTYHTNFMSKLLDSILKILNHSTVVKLISGISSITTFFISSLPLYSIPLSLFTTFIYSRTLTFFEHRQEYHSDKFAFKYGYGDEIITALMKLSKVKTIQPRSNVIQKTIAIFKSIFNFSSHPDNEDRIYKLSKTLKDEYMNDYPVIKEDLKKILQNI